MSGFKFRDHGDGLRFFEPTGHDEYVRVVILPPDGLCRIAIPTGLPEDVAFAVVICSPREHKQQVG